MRPLSDAQCAFLSAALRHARDASHLCAPGPHQSIEQAWHLAGFAPECARKALLSDVWMCRLLGHEVGDDVALYLDWLLSLDPAASRYPYARPVANAALWTPESRYCATGQLREKTRSKAPLQPQAVEALCVDGEAFAWEITAALWLDGRIKEAR